VTLPLHDKAAAFHSESQKDPPGMHAVAGGSPAPCEALLAESLAKGEPGLALAEVLEDVRQGGSPSSAQRQRQRDLHGGALADLAADRDGAVVGLEDVLNDVHPQARALRHLVGL